MISPAIDMMDNSLEASAQLTGAVEYTNCIFAEE